MAASEDKWMRRWMPWLALGVLGPSAAGVGYRGLSAEPNPEVWAKKEDVQVVQADLRSDLSVIQAAMARIEEGQKATKEAVGEVKQDIRELKAALLMKGRR